MPAAVTQQAGRFIIVGTIGFFVDGGILTVLYNIFDFSLLHTRLVSFCRHNYLVLEPTAHLFRPQGRPRDS